MKIKKIVNNFLCFLFGHTGTNICQRCGKQIDREQNGGLLRRFKKHLYTIQSETEFKGSIQLKTGLKMYELNMKTNELRLLDVKINKDDETGNIERKAQYNPLCCYIQAINDKNAIRKANAQLRNIKQGVFVTEVKKNEGN